MKGELFFEDSIPIDKRLVYKTKQGRKVFGGGGIVPDVFIPLDTLRYSSVINRLYFSGVLTTFAFEFTDNNRAKFLNDYKTAQSFITNYSVTNKEVEALKNYLVSKKVTNLNFSLNDKGFKEILKALIGRNLFDKDAYYPILNKNDNAIQKAVDVLNKK